MGKEKRKHSKSPTNPIEVKKIKPDSKDNQENNPTPESKKVKPIFIEESFQVVRGILDKIKLSTRPLCKIKENKSIQVSCFNLDDKKKIIDNLKKKLIGFNTFTESSEKNQCYILKGFYNTSCDELLTILQSSKVPAIKVSDLIRKDDHVIYIVQFANNFDTNCLNLNHKTIDSMIVKWEKLKRSSNKIMQCFKCQRFGHSSHGCGFEARCVKCQESHPRGQCKRINQEGDPTCVNCGGNHTANYQRCPTYIKYVENKAQRPNKTNQVKKQVELTSTAEFPRLSKVISNQDAVNKSSKTQTVSSHVSYAEKLQDAVKTDSLYKRLTNAQEKLRKIPDIEKTINDFCNFVDELSEIPNNNSARFNLLLKYNVARNESDEESSQDDIDMEEEYTISKNKDDESQYIKHRIINDENWWAIGNIEDLDECDKLKLTE